LEKSGGVYLIVGAWTLLPQPSTVTSSAVSLSLTPPAACLDSQKPWDWGWAEIWDLPASLDATPTCTFNTTSVPDLKEQHCYDKRSLSRGIQLIAQSTPNSPSFYVLLPTSVAAVNRHAQSNVPDHAVPSAMEPAVVIHLIASDVPVRAVTVLEATSVLDLLGQRVSTFSDWTYIWR